MFLRLVKGVIVYLHGGIVNRIVDISNFKEGITFQAVIFSFSKIHNLVHTLTEALVQKCSIKNLPQQIKKKITGKCLRVVLLSIKL